LERGEQREKGVMGFERMVTITASNLSGGKSHLKGGSDLGELKKIAVRICIHDSKG